MNKKLKINNMKCMGCVNRIKNTIDMLDNVKINNINLEEKTIDIEVKDNNVLNNVITTIKNLEFEVEVLS